MIDYHWMVKGNKSKKDLEEIMDSIHDVGYKSILLPFQIKKNEPIISATYLASKYENIKFMVAIRPYTITARHLAMMCRTFNEFYGNRLIINFVSGTDDDGEKIFTGSTNGIDQRRILLAKFIEDMIESLDIDELPTIGISGSSEKTLETVKKYGDMSINLLSDFERNEKEIKNSNKKIMARVSLDINDSKSNMNILCEKEENNYISGSENEIQSSINNIGYSGVTDLLISGMYAYNNDKLIHNFIKDIIVD